MHRSNLHIYAQVIDATGAKVLVSASSLEKDLRGRSATAATSRRRRWSASASPRKRARRASKQVAFDRAGYKYHGRVKALAEAAREAGLKF